jgi:hypothetical protein
MCLLENGGASPGAAAAALGDMVGMTGDDDTSEAGEAA